MGITPDAVAALKQLGGDATARNPVGIAANALTALKQLGGGGREKGPVTPTDNDRRCDGPRTFPGVSPVRGRHPSSACLSALPENGGEGGQCAPLEDRGGPGRN